jgi:hypothetical protein
MTTSERARAHCCALDEARESRRRPVALVELIATLSLALSTVVAAAAVSIGIARAEVFGMPADGDPAPLAVALLVGLLLLAMGGLAAVMANGPKGTA